MAASKVNKNFVVLLVTGIVALVGGVGGFAAYTFMRSGERNISRGDEFMAAGDYGSAQKAYSRAVNRDRSRVDWLNKWRSALEKWVPPNETEYRQAYSTYYLGVLRTIAVVQNKDPKSQAEFLKEIDGYLRKGSGGQVEAAKTFLRDVEERLKTLDPNDNETKKLLRYRGLARLDIGGDQPLPDDEKAQCLKDLETAFEADPTDFEVKIGIVMWHLQDAASLANNRRETDAQAAREKAVAILEDYLKANPLQPEALVLQLVLKQELAAQKAVTMDDRVKIVQMLRPLATELLDQMDKVPPAELRTELLWQLATRVRPLAGEGGAAKMIALADKALTARPGDPEVMMLAAEMTYESGDLAGTFDRFQRVTDLKDIPVSRQGMMLPGMRRVAAGRQVDTALDEWRKAFGDEAKRAAAMAKAKEYREKLKAIIDVASESELKLRDAYLAVAEGKNDVAIALLSELRSSTSKTNDHRVLLPLADALNRVGNLGEAAQIYDRLIDSGYIDAGVLSSAGLVHYNLQNMDKASDYIKRALALAPENKALQEISAKILEVKAAAAGDLSKVTDPVVKAIVKASATLKDGDARAAKVQYEELYKNYGSDPRVLRFYVNYLLQDDNRQRALEVLDKAIAEQPDNRDWPRMKLVVQNPDRDMAMLALIDEGDAPKEDKLVQKYQIYNRKGMKKEAEEAYNEAVKTKPDAPAVVECGFMREVQKIIENRGPQGAAARAAAEGEAQKFVTIASEKNLDQLGGMLYKARLLMAQEKFRDAALLVKQAVEKVPNNPGAWRLLAMANMEAGNIEDGLNAFQRALDGQPNNGSVAKDYAKALIRVARAKDAHAILNPETGVLRFAENAADEELVNMWLDIEATVMGPSGVAKAIDRRRLIFNRRPDNIVNTVSLARVLTTSEQYEDAGKVIETLAKQPEAKPDLVTRLRADLLAAQKKYEDGEKVFKDYIASLGDKAEVKHWLMFANWLSQNERVDQALAAFDEARKLQTKEFEADRQKGDYMFNAFSRIYEAGERLKNSGEKEKGEAETARANEMLAGAEKCYKAIIDGDADEAATGFAVTKRLVETQLRLEHYDDAGKTLERLAKISPPEAKISEDLQYILLQATLAERKGDTRAARRLYDTAVERYPGDPRGFTARAMLTSKDDALFPDTVADLTQVTRMIPANPLAWNMLFALHEKRGLTEQAFTLLTKAVDQNPNNDELSKLFVERLAQAGRREAALGHMLKMVARDNKKADPFIIRSAGAYAMALEKWREGADMFKLVRAVPGMDDTENRSYHLHCLLKRQNPLPEKGEVGELLRLIETDEAQNNTLAGLMLRARAEAFLGATDEGMKLAKEGYKKAETSRQVFGWFTDATDMFWLSFKPAKGTQFFRDLPDGRRLAQKEVFDKFRTVRTPVPPILTIMEIPFRQQAGEPLQKLVDEVVKLDPVIKDDMPARVEMFRAQNQLYYALGNYEKSLEANLEGMKIAPNEPEFLNNAAYTLSKQLKKPSEGLPYAEKAVKLAPTNSAALDTLGQIQIELGKIEDAINTLTKAADFAKGPDEVIAANVHLGVARMEMKPTPDLLAARKCYDRAKEAMTKLPEFMRKQFDADMESLRRRVE
jgi:tetratricopeptide (TPR) repeat protein